MCCSSQRTLGAVGGIIDPEFKNARQGVDVPFTEPDAGGADDALQHQRRFADVFAFGADKTLLQIRPVVQFQSAQFMPGITSSARR